MCYRAAFISVGVGIAGILMGSAVGDGEGVQGARPTPGPTCLHDARASRENIARRRQAHMLARAINSAQASIEQRTKRYGPLSAVPALPETPEGFVLKFYTDGDGEGYMFSLKDGRDPCRYGVFSDEDGVLHEGVAVVPLLAR
jgi:hypothetical protein